jgi:hypothetical protein
MSPEGRKPSSFGPLARDRYRRAGKFASLALVVAAGLVTPIAAVAHSESGQANTAYSGGDCEHRAGLPGGDHDKDKCPRPTHTPSPSPTNTKPPRGCFDIDSAAHSGNAKFVSVVCNGQVFVLPVDERGGPTTPPTPFSGFTLVPGVNNVIDATLAINDNQLFVTVLTADNVVLEASCPANPPSAPLGNCTTFHTLGTPPAA